VGWPLLLPLSKLSLQLSCFCLLVLVMARE
jgi:hypothetical protein